MALNSNKPITTSVQSSKAGLGLNPDIQQRHYEDIYGDNSALITALTARVTTLEAGGSSNGTLLDVQTDVHQSATNCSSSGVTIATITFTGVAATDKIVLSVDGMIIEGSAPSTQNSSAFLKRNGSEITRKDLFSTVSSNNNNMSFIINWVDTGQSGTVVYTLFGSSSLSTADWNRCNLIGRRFKAP
jgi:hypothetical protein